MKTVIEKLKNVDLKKLLRIAIQLFFLIRMPSAFTAAFSGVKYLFTQLGMGEPFVLTSFLAVLLVLLAYTIVFGRFFCGYACFFGTFNDWVHEAYLLICRWFRYKPHQIGEKQGKAFASIKYVVLVLICLLCYWGLWERTRGMSPWEVFSMISAGRFDLAGYGFGIAFLFIIFFGVVFTDRFFCRFFCPMGAVFSLMPVLPFFSLHRKKTDCIKGCKACTKTCPSCVELPDDGSIDVSGDCFWCQRCIGSCTVLKLRKKKGLEARSNISCGISGLQGDELWFTLLRAVLLYAAMLIAGVS